MSTPEAVFESSRPDGRPFGLFDELTGQQVLAPAGSEASSLALAQAASYMHAGTDVTDVADRAVRCAVDLVAGTRWARLSAVAGGVSTTLASTGASNVAVSTVPVVARRVRLEKYVVTETRTVTVQVRREEVRLVEVDPTTQPATDDQATADPDRWLIVSEERPVVTLQVVPVERVRLSVISVTEDQDITEDVRREHVTVEHDPGIDALMTEPHPPHPTTPDEGLR